MSIRTGKMAKEKMPVRTQNSAGGVVFRRSGPGFDVALVSVKGGKVWTLPKGLINKGESPRETALREVAEETGLKGEIMDDLGEITYWYVAKETPSPRPCRSSLAMARREQCRVTPEGRGGNQTEYIRYKKTVYFYLMEYLSGDTANHDWEVDECAWFPLEKAIETVTYKGDRQMLEKAKELLERG